MSISDRLDEIEAHGVWWHSDPVAEGHKADMLAALRAVFDLHKRVSELGFMDYCAECIEFDDDLDPEMSDAATRVVWPCPTYCAVTAALGEEA